MDIYIESEMRDAVFHDPDFVNHFLHGNEKKLDAVLEHCHTSRAYDRKAGTWKLPKKITREQRLYKPVLEILNAIKLAMHTVGNPSDPYEESSTTLFQGCWSQTIPSDEAETVGIKPDLVLFEDVDEHWESVRMAVEIKKLPGHHKAAMKQLARYARAMFAHQIHRRHLYGMMVCSTEATFVRFDRAGILYSKRIDIRKNADTFTRAFASLLMLNRADQGYDTVFETRPNEERRLEYHINLPASAFAGPSTGSNVANTEQSTRRFKVIEKLCHRKSICGRATIVLRIQEDLKSDSSNDAPGEPNLSDDETQGIKTRNQKPKKRKAQEMESSDQPMPSEYVLKMIWRDPERESEGEVLERVQGMFGLAQYVWHCDRPGPCRCSPPAEGGCTSCVDRTAQVNGLMVCNNLRDIAVEVPVDDEDGTLTNKLGEHLVVDCVALVC
jgi:hypothetical protein